MDVTFAAPPREASCKVAGVPREPIFKGDYSFNTGRIKTLVTFDYIILIAALVISTMIGIFVAWNNRRRMGIEDFLLAGRHMNAIPVGLSMAATFLSGITVIGLPVFMYTNSSSLFWMSFGYIIAMGTIASVFIPVFYQLRLTSAYEYLEKRFSRGVRVLASTFFIAIMLASLSLILYAPSLSISSVTGFDLWTSIVSVVSVCIVYTTLGGMKAVIYADAFHAVVMAVGLLAVAIKAIVTVGSWSDMWESAKRTNRLTLDDYRPDPTNINSVWSAAIGMYIYTLIMFGANHIQVHRYLCCRTLDVALRTVWTCVPAVLIVTNLGFIIGLFMSAFYENCDPKSAGLITSKDQMVPLFVMDTMSDTAGLPGLFMAVVFCATLSSASSALNSVATVTLEDFVRLYIKLDLREDRARRMTQVLTVIFGLICLELTFLAAKTEGLLGYDAVTGALAPPLLSVFILGLFFPWANKKGAFFGMIGGAVFNVAVLVTKMMAKLPPPALAITCVSNCNATAFPNSTALLLTQPATTPAPIIEPSKVNYFLRLHGRVMDLVVSLSLGFTASYLTGLRKPRDLDPRLIVPVCDVLFPFYYLPESTRKKLRFGINHKGKWQKELSKGLSPAAYVDDGPESFYNPPLSQETDSDSLPAFLQLQPDHPVLESEV